MKKSLLLGIALTGAMSMLAQAPTNGTDVTPAGYKISDIDAIPWYDNGWFAANGGGFVGGANYSPNSRAGKGVWVNMGSEAQEYWDKNNGIMGCAWVLDEEEMEKIIGGWNLIDLGGEVGQVLCWQGQYSNLKEGLEEYYPDADWSVLPEPAENLKQPGFNLNFFLDPSEIFTKSMGFYRFRMVLNAKHHATDEDIENEKYDFGEGVIVTNGVYQVNNQNNNTSFIYTGETNEEGELVNKAIKDSEFIYPVNANLFIQKTANGGTIENEYGDPIWDPTKCAVVEYYFNVAGNEEGVDENGDATVPVRIKIPMSPDMNKLAILIKEVSLTKYTDLLTQGVYDLNAAEFEIQNIYPVTGEPLGEGTPGGDNGDGDDNGEGDDNGAVEGIEADITPVVYYNLQGLKVDSPVKGQIYIANGKKVIY